MATTAKISAIFYCSLERAFKTPILCDVTKIHTGFGVMPKVTHCTDDESWGQPGHSKKVFVDASFSQNGGFASVDTVIERSENQQWIIEVSDFQSWMLGFYKFRGTWKTTELATDKILVEYSYSLYSELFFLYPVNWLFTKLFWKNYMKKVLNNVRQLAYDKEPYLYK